MEGLVTVIDSAQELRSAKQEEAKSELLEEFRHRAAAMGLSLESLFPHSGGSRRRSETPVAPKYRGPQGETWSSRGVSPTWLKALEAQGHDKQLFYIQEDGTTQWEQEHKSRAA